MTPSQSHVLTNLQLLLAQMKILSGINIIRAACEKRIAGFLQSRGVEIWSGLLEMDPVPSTVRYDVLKLDRKCVLCGAAPEIDSDVRLHVDHIILRSKGGSNKMNNLQVLCAECNLGKSNRDDTALGEINDGRANAETA